MNPISETMSQSDMRIVDARVPDEIAIEAMHLSDGARSCGCKSELAVVDNLTKDIAKAFAAKDREITRLRVDLDRAKREREEWWAQAQMFAQKLAQFESLRWRVVRLGNREWHLPLDYPDW
jgi:hypothetical protein